MKKQIITGMVIIACVALCAAVWPRSTGDGKVPAEPGKTAVSAEIEAGPEETQSIFLSDDTYNVEAGIIAESEPTEAEGISAEEKAETTPTTSVKTEATVKPSSDPKPGTVSVINGEQYSWFPGFGWVKDEGGGSVTIPVDGEGDINKQVARP